jgi:DEAD/DEAH box helicase domain-containing protein
MLHTGILPHHTKWQKLFANLTYVVVDELHVYRGVFGSHLTNVFRRLKRVCRFYGTDRSSSAARHRGQPGEHAENLLEKEVALIDESGAPGRQDLHPVQPAHREPGARHPPVGAHPCEEDRG